MPSEQEAAHAKGFNAGNAPGPYDPPPVLASDPLSADVRIGYDAGRKHFHATHYPPNAQGHVYPLDTTTAPTMRVKL